MLTDFELIDDSTEVYKKFRNISDNNSQILSIATKAFIRNLAIDQFSRHERIASNIGMKGTDALAPKSLERVWVGMEISSSPLGTDQSPVGSLEKALMGIKSGGTIVFMPGRIEGAYRLTVPMRIMGAGTFETLTSPEKIPSEPK